MRKGIVRHVALLLALVFLLGSVYVAAPANSTTPLQLPPAEQFFSSFGESDDVSAGGIVQTLDNGYALIGTLGNGYYPNTALLVKTDSAGKMQWNKTYEFLSKTIDLLQTGDGGYAILGDGPTLVKTDSIGNIQWKQTYTVPGGYGGGVYSMVQTNDGGYMIAGRTGEEGDPVTNDGAFYWPHFGFLIKTDWYGNVQWNKTYGAPRRYNMFNSVVQASDGGYAATGTTSFNGSADIYDLYFWLVKTDVNGTLLWDGAYGSGPGINLTGNILNEGRSGDNRANSIVQTADGSYVMAGFTFTYGAGGSDAWLVKTDSQGTMAWNKTYGYEGDDSANSLILTSDGGLAFAGKTVVEGAWLVKTDESGAVEWNQTYGGGGYSLTQEPKRLIETSDGGFAMTGDRYFTGSLTFFYLIKTEPALPPPPTREFPPVPPPNWLSGSNLVLLVLVIIVTAAVVAVAAVVYLKKRKR
jgi:hypothetical protein